MVYDPQMTALSIGLVCDLGVGERFGGRKRNEDNYLVCHEGLVRYRLEQSEQRLIQWGEGTLVAVCDGMGGHEDGDVASAAAVQVLAKLYRPGHPRNPEHVLQNYVHKAHRQLYDAVSEDGPVSMGTTVTVAWFIGDVLYWVNVGDSRLYLWRSGRIQQMTVDQTRNAFALRDGKSETPDGHHLVQNFIYGSRGLGDNTQLRIESGQDTGAIQLLPGDRVLLCSDGLTKAVVDNQLSRILSDRGAPQPTAEQLTDLAKRLGSRDNITTLLLDVDEDDSDPVSEENTDDLPTVVDRDGTGRSRF
ncbi:MAG: protein phosphatase 2C domain-containing protein [Myxococcota bacterium]